MEITLFYSLVWSTVTDIIAARVLVRRQRTEARHQQEREHHRQRRVAGTCTFKKFSFRGGGGMLVGEGGKTKQPADSEINTAGTDV